MCLNARTEEIAGLLGDLCSSYWSGCTVPHSSTIPVCVCVNKYEYACVHNCISMQTCYIYTCLSVVDDAVNILRGMPGWPPCPSFPPLADLLYSGR